MNDIFDSHTRSLTSPPENGTAVIPDNSTDLVHVTRAIYVGGGGDLALRLLDGTGSGLCQCCRRIAFADPGRHRVLATGTTATRIVGLW